ncbi:MAG: tyrosine-type recombinase/integrase, partial [Acidimicrobiales bacterium]
LLWRSPGYADVGVVRLGDGGVGHPEVGITRRRMGLTLFSPCDLLERSKAVHSVPNPSRVRFVGPLAPFAPGLVEELASLGYTATSATMQMQLAASLSRWLDATATGIGLEGLTEPVMERFLLERRAKHTSHYSPLALAPIVGYLRRAGVVPAAVASARPVTAADVLLGRFAGYLAGPRGLTPPVVRAYVHWVRPFTEDVLCPAGVDRVGEVSAGEVAVFLAARLPVMSRKSAQMTACALRSLLRFLHAEALVDVALADAVPTVASWRLSGLPRALTSTQVQALLEACDGSNPVSRRDLAVITLMRRLGLRCAEVASMRLEDIDWLAGTVTIHGKSSRVDRMPLPVDAGHALVDYLRQGRPDTPARTVFVRANAPFTPLKPSSVSCIVARAARRAGLGTVHGHRLRHSAATETLNAGAGLEEVAQLMRHDGVATTVIYAKTDQTRLARLARPWPTGTGAR